MRTGFLHLAEALAYRRDAEVPLRAVIVMLKAGERCNAEAELVGKGIKAVLKSYRPTLILFGAILKAFPVVF